MTTRTGAMAVKSTLNRLELGVMGEAQGDRYHRVERTRCGECSSTHSSPPTTRRQRR